MQDKDDDLEPEDEESTISEGRSFFVVLPSISSFNIASFFLFLFVFRFVRSLLLPSSPSPPPLPFLPAYLLPLIFSFLPPCFLPPSQAFLATFLPPSLFLSSSQVFLTALLTPSFLPLLPPCLSPSLFPFP